MNTNTNYAPVERVVQVQKISTDDQFIAWSFAKAGVAFDRNKVAVAAMPILIERGLAQVIAGIPRLTAKGELPENRPPRPFHARCGGGCDDAVRLFCVCEESTFCAGRYVEGTDPETHTHGCHGTHD